jgi:hypothetical protein
VSAIGNTSGLRCDNGFMIPHASNRRAAVDASLGRPLVLTYAALFVPLDVLTALPGNPDYSSRNGAIVLVALQALLVWRLWHGSEIAWSLGLLGSLSLVVTTFLVGETPAEPTVAAVLALSVGQAALLLTPPVYGHVWSNADAATESR